MKTSNHRHALIMAGGIGSRFWPVSTVKNPKQFQDLTGEGRSLLQQTYDRLLGLIPAENIWVLTHERYTPMVQQQLPKVSAAQIIAEPAQRNTAPCLLLAAMKLQKKDPFAQLLVVPSDHYIAQTKQFQDDVAKAFIHAQNTEDLLTFGILPSSPHTGYGYIEVGNTDAEISPILTFREKPSLEKAKTLIDRGNYFWNAGIFVWQARTLISAFEQLSPKMYSLFALGESFYNTEKEIAFLENHYAQAEDISIDYAILEKATHVSMVKASFEWNDLGSWKALHQQLGQNEIQNVIVNADLLSDTATGNLIYSSAQKQIVIKGIHDLVVVATPDKLLIFPKSDDQSIKELSQLASQKFEEKN